MYLIVGLGNPGSAYEFTRHNVGFRTIDLLAKDLGVSLKKLKFKSLIAETKIGQEKVILMKPQTYMNESGRAVFDCVTYFDIDPEHIIVICDDIDIPFGTIRIKKKGSAGTHNGLKSIIYQIQAENFPRVKIAIGEKGRYELKDFVLSRFTANEEKVIEREIQAAKDAIVMMINENVSAAMNQVNGQSYLNSTCS